MRFFDPCGKIFKSHLRRRFFRIESLESRTLLAAGFLGLELAVPIDRTAGGFTVVGTANLGVDVMILDPSDSSALSITNPIASGNGTLSGNFSGFDVVGSFEINDLPPIYKFTFSPPNTLSFEVSTSGTLDLLVEGIDRVSGSFTSTVQGDIDIVTRRFDGLIHLNATADGFTQSIDVPVEVFNAIDVFEVPNSSLASIADQVFADANNNGIKDAGEVGVGGVVLALLDGQTNQMIESVVSDDEGYYSFYNLSAGQFALKVDGIPDGFDLGKQSVGSDDAVDSDVNSRTGQSDVLDLFGTAHLRNVDVALRQVVFEWQNPNLIADVTGDGTVSALDALRVINAIGRRGGSFILDPNRPIGLEFFDVTGDGLASALDALRIINELARINSSLTSTNPEKEVVLGAVADLKIEVNTGIVKNRFDASRLF